MKVLSKKQVNVSLAMNLDVLYFTRKILIRTANELHTFCKINQKKSSIERKVDFNPCIKMLTLFMS